MNKQEDEFIKAFGEAMFYAHLIEDLLALHLYDCGRFKVNGIEGLSRRKIRDMDAEERINMLLNLYELQNSKDGSITKLTKALHNLRKIRNFLTHAFITQVGSDLVAEEGVDQVMAMLRQIIKWEQFWLSSLQRTHEELMNTVISKPELLMSTDDTLFDARVSSSKIQKLIKELENQYKQ